MSYSFSGILLLINGAMDCSQSSPRRGGFCDKGRQTLEIDLFCANQGDGVVSPG